MPSDSRGQPLTVGDRVLWRGIEYTITGFIPDGGRWPGVAAILFDQVPHQDETPDEIAVDLVASVRPSVRPLPPLRSSCCRV